MYSLRLHIDNRLSFGRFVGSGWNTLKKKIEKVNQNEIIRSFKGRDRHGVYVELSADKKHFYNVDRAHELLTAWHAKLLQIAGLTLKVSSQNRYFTGDRVPNRYSQTHNDANAQSSRRKGNAVRNEKGEIVLPRFERSAAGVAAGTTNRFAQLNVSGTARSARPARSQSAKLNVNDETAFPALGAPPAQPANAASRKPWRNEPRRNAKRKSAPQAAVTRAPAPGETRTLAQWEAEQRITHQKVVVTKPAQDARKVYYRHNAESEVEQVTAQKPKARAKPVSNGKSFYVGHSAYVPPRDPDWHCPKCSVSNFASRHKCRECSARKPKTTYGAPTLSNLPASVHSTPAPSVSRASVGSSSNSHAPSVASDAGSVGSRSMSQTSYPPLPPKAALPAPKAQPIPKQEPAKRRPAQHKRRVCLNDTRNCKGSFRAEIYNKTDQEDLDEHLNTIATECETRFGVAPGWWIRRTGRSTRTVEWTVRGQAANKFLWSEVNNANGPTRTSVPKKNTHMPRPIAPPRWLVNLETGHLEYQAPPTPPAAPRPAQQCNGSVEDPAYDEWVKPSRGVVDVWESVGVSPSEALPIPPAAPQPAQLSSGSVGGNGPCMPWEKTGNIPALELGGKRPKPVAVSPPPMDQPW